MANSAQRGFRFGEIAPALYGAAGMVPYAEGLRTCRNIHPTRTGGLRSRAGLLYKGTTKSNGFARLIPAVFDDDQNYVLEVGDEYIRFWRDGVQITATVTGAWANGATYDAGEVVSYSGTNYVALQDHMAVTVTNRPSDGSSWQDFWYALTDDIYELPAPWTTQAEVRELQYAAQSAVVRFAHNTYTRRTLTRLADNEWSLREVTVSEGGLDTPTNLTITVGTPGSQTEWVVTAYDAASSRESSASASTGTTSDLAALQSTPETLTWTAVTGATQYRVYRKDEDTGGIYGLLATVNSNTYTDAASVFLPADVTTQPPAASAAFTSPDDYPGVIGAYQQRILLSGFPGDPAKVLASKVGAPDDFTFSTPLVDSDTLDWRMIGQRVVRPLHFLEVAKRLIQFASSGEYIIEGDDTGILSPGAINPRQLSVNGVAKYPAPLPVNASALYVQSRGQLVRDLAGDVGDDLTRFAAHLVDGYQIVEWAFQQVPDPVVWAVRDDGVLLSLTYDRNSGLLGWARHDTEGSVESVCVVPEGTEDAVYVVVNRTINSGTVRYMERLDNRLGASAVFADAATTTARLAGTLTVTLFGLDLSENVSVFTIDASGNIFTADDVGRAMRLRLSGTWYTVNVVGYTDANTVTAWLNGLSPDLAGNYAADDWFFPPDLRHLVGETVSVVADGTILASPNNPEYATATVTALTTGAVSPVTSYTIPLTEAFESVTVGLPFVVDVQTLDVDAVSSTIKDRGIFVGGVKVWVEDTATFWAGPKEPTSSTAITTLERQVPRDDEGYEIAALDAGVVSGVLLASWNQTGRVFLRNVDPTPMTILAISPQGHFGGR